MANFGLFRGFSDKLFEGELPTQLGKIGSQSFGELLLDSFPNAAAAYSLRKLRTAYTGSAIRVRRSSDNTEQDIGFVNNVLDTATLTSFCSGTNGFVTTWYDQSGNARDVTQTTAANQPQIVSSGSILNLNGKPTLRFDGSNDALIRTSFNFPTTNISMVKINSRIGTSLDLDSIGYATNGGFINLNASTVIGIDGRPSGSTYLSAKATTTGTNNQILQLNIYNGSNLKASYNGNTFATTAVSANPIVYGNQNFNLGATISTSDYANSNNQEFVMWPSDQSSNKSGIESNINTYYGIY